MRSLIPILIAGASFAVSMPLRSSAAEQFHEGEQYEDIYYLPSEDVLIAASLGYREALADLIWMRAQVYIGDEFHHQGGVNHVFDYIEAVLSLDPDFQRAYRWIGVTGIYRPRNSTTDEVRRTVAIMERGTERFPRDHDLAWELGATYQFDLMPRLEEGAERDRAGLRAAELMQQAARSGVGPSSLVFQNAALLRRMGQVELAVRHLEEIYAITTDEELKAQIRMEIELREGQIASEGIIATLEALEAERREEYPYLPATLYLLVGPRPDLEALPSRWFIED